MAEKLTAITEREAAAAIPSCWALAAPNLLNPVPMNPMLSP